jgi:MEMO1 family protein
VTSNIRRAAVAGTWYPGSPGALRAAVEGHLERAGESRLTGDVVALVAPHAGLMYSGPVAAYAYALLRGRALDAAVLVGPSHFVGFDGVALWPAGGFETPLGVSGIDEDFAEALLKSTPIVHAHTKPHVREHSLEMQLPFLQHLAPAARIVPLLVGYQTAETARVLGDALASVLRTRRALLVASTDLSHYHEARTAQRLDAVVLDCLARFDADGLQNALNTLPDHACGGGPTVAVLRAAHALGASHTVVLNYADSGDVSGDKSSVVGYVSAATGTFSDTPSRLDR